MSDDVRKEPVYTEEQALGLLHRLRYKDGVVHCHLCRSDRVYRLAEGRYRCSRCRYTFGPLTGTWFSRSRLNIESWMRLVLLFESGKSARAASRITGISYPTVLRIFTVIRCAIIAAEQPDLLPCSECIDDEKTAPVENKHALRKACPTSTAVFAVQFDGNRVSLAVPTDIVPDVILENVHLFDTCGKLAITDRYQHYEALILYLESAAWSAWDKRLFRSTKHKPMCCKISRFWLFVREHFLDYRNISLDKLPHYLFEMQFRYNHRHQDLFVPLLKSLVATCPV